MSNWNFNLNAVADESTGIPLGYNPSLKTLSDSQTEQTALTNRAATLKKLKEKRAMQMAKAPGQSLFMTAFMLYMSGSTVHVFSIMITGMAVINPVKQLLSVNTVFSKLDDGELDLTMAKLTFLGLNLVALCMGLYKWSTMGLLPLHSSDWFKLVPVKEAVEFSGGSPFN